MKIYEDIDKNSFLYIIHITKKLFVMKKYVSFLLIIVAIIVWCFKGYIEPWIASPSYIGIKVVLGLTLFTACVIFPLFVDPKLPYSRPGMSVPPRSLAIVSLLTGIVLLLLWQTTEQHTTLIMSSAMASAGTYCAWFLFKKKESVE